MNTSTAPVLSGRTKIDRRNPRKGRLGGWLAVILALLITSCSTLTPARTEHLCAIAKDSAQWGTENWLVDNPDHRKAFTITVDALHEKVRQGETNQIEYVKLFQGLPRDRWVGNDGELYVTESALVIWDKQREKSTVVEGALSEPVWRAVVMGIRRGMAPRPPLPGGLRYSK